MHNILLTVSYKSLGKNLETISNHPAVIASTDLLPLVRSAMSFHQQLEKDFRGLLEENHALRQELSLLTREPGEVACGGETFRHYGEYERMRDAGKKPVDVYQAAKREGLDYVSLVRVLRAVFNLSLDDAREIVDSAEKE